MGTSSVGLRTPATYSPGVTTYAWLVAQRGTSMEAQVVSATQRRVGGGPDDGEVTLYDAVTDRFGSVTWDIDLTVTSAAGEQFNHCGPHKIANRVGGFRKMFTAWRPVPGLTFPVLVSDDRKEVTIDWADFVRRGGIDQAIKLGDAQRAARAQVQGAAAAGQMLAKRPKLSAKQREMALQLGPGMAAEVPTGVRPAREFEQWISGLVQGGALDQVEGDDLLRQAGLIDL